MGNRGIKIIFMMLNYVKTANVIDTTTLCLGKNT